MTAPVERDVVVVGAGLAGLYCALLLEAEGADVEVVEAQARLGGRIHSMRQLGSNAEAGGTFIGAGYQRVFALASRFAVPLVDVTPMLAFFREQDLALGGTLIRQSEWASHPANPFPEADKAIMPWNYHRVLTMRDNPLPEPRAWLDPAFAGLDISMRQWLRGAGLSEQAVNLSYNLNTSYGLDADDVSALFMLFKGAFSKAQRRHAPGDSLGFTVEGGVQRLPEAMAAGLHREVRRDSAVVSLREEGSQVAVGLNDGRTILARQVICGISFGALRNIRMEPALAPALTAALNALPGQPLTQFYLGFKREYWHDDGYAPSMFTDGRAGMVAAVRDGTDPQRITHLTAWAMGRNAAALDALSEAAAAAEVIATIETLRPAAQGQLELITRQSWGTDPWALGAWAYYRPGQVGEFGAAMQQRHHGRVHLCGEQFAVADRGMEGALESAESSAAAVGNLL